jgi:hypothetical protein
VASVHKRTIPNERLPLVSEVSANFFADRGCHVVSVTNPYGCILGFLIMDLNHTMHNKGLISKNVPNWILFIWSPQQVLHTFRFLFFPKSVLCLVKWWIQESRVQHKRTLVFVGSCEIHVLFWHWIFYSVTATCFDLVTIFKWKYILYICILSHIAISLPLFFSVFCAACWCFF